MLGVGKLMEISNQKRDEVAESLTVGLNEEKWGNSTKKGMNQFLHKVLLVVVDRRKAFMNGWKDSTGNCVFTLISGFHRVVDEFCSLLGYYAAACGNCLPTFRDNVSVPSSRVKSPRGKESQLAIT
jgi:hypothetical protein